MKFRTAKLTGWILTLVIITCFIFGCSQKSETLEKVTLRSETATLSKEELNQLVKAKGFHSPGMEMKGSFKHSYEQAEILGVKTIIDHATGLMWQQTEDETRFNWKEAEAYVANMNQKNLAGFSDWRIPTVEELMSLVESKKSNNNFINPLFQKELLSTWTIDEVKDAFAGAWFVDFAEGTAVDGNRAAGLGHVRLVRTLTSTD